MVKKYLAPALCGCLLFATAGAAFAADNTVYISPNNDGVQDELVIPLKIYDKRYVVSWSLVITNASGDTVRTIGNKVQLPEKMTFKSFFKRLLSPKQGVEIPSAVTWNGVMDNGETAPDGDYYYYFTATDDNGNTGYMPDIRKTQAMHVVVDNTPPHIDLTQPSSGDKIFGEGAKAEFAVKQNGSAEDLWLAEFRNMNGEVVKVRRFVSSEPISFSWNGTNDSGGFVPDGVYSYSISAVDRAGNKSAPASISGIIYSAEKPAVNIMITDGKYFSPGTASPLQTITFGVTIPVPSKSSGNKLTDWKVDIIDRSGKVYTSFKPSSASDTENPPSSIVFNGRDDNGTVLPQGEYQARVTAKYLNGFETDPVKSPAFVLDTTAPNAVVRVAEKIFSPDGDGVKDTITFSEMIVPKTGAPVKAWTGLIVDAADPDRIVRQYNFGEYPPETLTWDGIDSTGRLAADGSYKYVLMATDLAGNSCRKESESAFTLDTSQTEVVLARKDNAFSPNNDKAKDTMNFTVVSKAKSAVSSYVLAVRDASGAAVRTFTGSKNLPSSFVWDGKGDDGIICADGSYTADLTVVSENGSEAKASVQPFILDTKPPYLAASVPWTAFSPDGLSSHQTVPVTVTGCTEEDLWKGRIVNAKGATVKSYSWQGTVPESFEWDGTDEVGNIAADGLYTLVLESEDEAGNKFSTAIDKLALDTRETKAFVTADLDGISPNGDGFKDTQQFMIRTTLKEGIASWSFTITDAEGKAVRSWTNQDSPDVPAQIVWDGLGADGTVVESTCTGTLALTYAKGNVVLASSSPFISCITPPVLTVETAPEYFSPDNDGTDDDEFIKLSCVTPAPLESWSFVINDPQDKYAFWQTAGKSTITERIVWDGLSNTRKDNRGRAERVQSAMDYPYTLTVRDTLGLTSTVKGTIGVDILVIRDGNLLKMAVPSIIFRSDHADFKTSDEVKGGLDPAKARNNERVLKRVAEILNKFKDYKVTVVGHANRTTASADEETMNNPRAWGPALIPLSLERAEFVKAYLKSNGISEGRLSTEGKGGTELVVDWQDKENNWKNRRVEFILNK